MKRKDRSNQDRRREPKPTALEGGSESASAPADFAGVEGNAQQLKRLEKLMTTIASNMERVQIADYVHLINHPRRLIWTNLLAGTMRGVGIAIGFTIFTTTILYVLKAIGALNLPIVGDYIADIIQHVQYQLEGGRIY